MGAGGDPSRARSPVPHSGGGPRVALGPARPGDLCSREGVRRREPDPSPGHPPPGDGKDPEDPTGCADEDFVNGQELNKCWGYHYHYYYYYYYHQIITHIP